MDLSDVRAQIEFELTWRQNEMRQLHNHLAFISDDDKKRSYRKALVVMLYSHFEGFCKSAFSCYVNAINGENLKTSDVTTCIAAATLSDTFKALANYDTKCRIFKNPVPDDTKLHQFCRQADFIGELNNFWSQKVELPVDTIVDTESNLQPVVMRKILYRLGFPYDIFATHEGKILFLVGIRNEIAHGTYRGGIEEDMYEDLESVTYMLMGEILRMLMQSLKNKSYLKT